MTVESLRRPAPLGTASWQDPRIGTVCRALGSVAPLSRSSIFTTSDRFGEILLAHFGHVSAKDRLSGGVAAVSRDMG